MPNRVQTKHPVTEVLEEHLQLYLNDLGDTPPSNVYEMVLNSIERPMLQLIMQHAKDNQSLAAEYLGLNRNTLRKKLLAHGLLSK
ncbi:MAG: Fis family transcriptional regulator [Polynucleobacter sp.]|jgi:Fis family transcriptional regulator|nr:Fis family transcriptional regulator [Polynucleobacter sp.]